MRVWILFPVLLLVSFAASAADLCPRIGQQTFAPDAATRIAALACHEHALWYRPFIDRNGRIASSTIMEGEAAVLDDGQSEAWRRVARYWQESGVLRQVGQLPGAVDCESAAFGIYPSPGCRGFVIDNPWSAAFVSWVMRKAALPGFRASASHITYVRDAYQRPESSAYQFVDPAHARPAGGDLLCYARNGSRVYGYAGLLSLVASGSAGLEMHCDIVVAVNPGNDSTAYLIGGNVQQGVTMRLLPLNRNGEFWGLPQRGGASLCAPDNEAACNFNRQDWAVLLKLKTPEALARLPGAATLAPVPAEPSGLRPPMCCINCVVGSGVPRCPPATER
ncbi:MAG: DUF2272 domain-containing protein [Pseudoxanthomonas sp.]